MKERKLFQFIQLQFNHNQIKTPFAQSLWQVYNPTINNHNGERTPLIDFAIHEKFHLYSQYSIANKSSIQQLDTFLRQVSVFNSLDSSCYGVQQSFGFQQLKLLTANLWSQIQIVAARYDTEKWCNNDTWLIMWAVILLQTIQVKIQVKSLGNQILYEHQTIETWFSKTQSWRIRIAKIF